MTDARYVAVQVEKVEEVQQGLSEIGILSWSNKGWHTF